LGRGHREVASVPQDMAHTREGRILKVQGVGTGRSMSPGAPCAAACVHVL
jgi:hypothetical protein